MILVVSISICFVLSFGVFGSIGLTFPPLPQIKGENVAGPSSMGLGGGDVKMESADTFDDDDEEDEDMEEVS